MYNIGNNDSEIAYAGKRCLIKWWALTENNSNTYILMGVNTVYIDIERRIERAQY